MTDQTSQSKIRRKRSPGLKIAAPIPVEVRRDDFTKESWLSAGDIRCGLDASGKNYRVTDEELGCWADVLSDAIRRSLEIQRTPIAGDYEHTVKVLKSVVRDCTAVRSSILKEMPEIEKGPLAQSEENRILAVQEALSCTDSPALRGLLSAASGPDRRNDGVEAFMAAFIALDRLRFWSEEVEQQFEIQAIRARVQKASKSLDNLSSSLDKTPSISDGIVVSRQGVTRQVGKKLLDIFEQATNDLPRLTRDRPTYKHPYQPGGSAIRFLQVMFDRIREKLTLAGMREVSLREWSPRAETLADWIKSYQAAKIV